ncbi:relaxase/mobilization nuclease domain-containing protein [Candidatus Palauibacter sp.]|uniref:relaxase/mobilization nuclease domain-containing protein n=1 Tax=Candidatus Palauibacter sp. TaxID=3101350 RepID=UPI003B515532
MIPKINSLGRSFAGAAAYCLHDSPTPDDRSPETSERVAWADTRNLATFRPERAARLMAATAKAAPDLKRLAGGSPGGPKLAKPVLHYSLSWAQDETPDRREMSRAVDGSLEVLGLDGHEALVVAHDDTRHPHVHVVANRVDPETGKAAKLGNSKRATGARVRREGLQPGRARRARGPRDEERVDMEAWRRAEAEAWETVAGGRERGLQHLESRARKEWAELLKRQEEMRQRLDRESRTVLGRLRIWRLDRSLRELAGAIRGREDLVEGWREDLDRYHRDERAELGKAHGERAREIERRGHKFYRSRLVDAERNAWAVRETMREREQTRARERERCQTITRIVVPPPPRPRGPERGGGGFER